MRPVWSFPVAEHGGTCDAGGCGNPVLQKAQEPSRTADLRELRWRLGSGVGSPGRMEARRRDGGDRDHSGPVGALRSAWRGRVPLDHGAGGAGRRRGRRPPARHPRPRSPPSSLSTAAACSPTRPSWRSAPSASTRGSWAACDGPHATPRARAASAPAAAAPANRRLAGSTRHLLYIRRPPCAAHLAPRRRVANGCKPGTTKGAA